MMTQKGAKNAENYTCEKCAFTCSKKCNYDKHLLTRKHQNDDAELQKRSKKMPDGYTCGCGKQYTHRQGLHAHKKNCDFTREENESTTKGELKMITTMMMEMMKNNTDLQKQMLEVCKINTVNMTTHNTNNSHSHNKTFNLQFFLNEQCKDAMNISEFVDSFELQLEDLESVGELGYVEGMTKIIVDKLNSMDVYKRPMHCSDAKREIIYIKDADKWERETRDNPKLRKAIKTVSFKNMKLAILWSDTYPESKSSESSMNDIYMKIIIQSTGGSGEIANSEDKIIRRIVKEIIISK
jgi:hypothetical protein